MRLLLLTPGKIASSLILDMAFSGMVQQGTILYCGLDDFTSSFTDRQKAVQEADVVFFLRCFTPESLDLLRLAKRLDKLTIVSTDDDFRALDPQSPLGKVHHQPENMLSYETLFGEADLTWFFTEEMKQRYQSLNANARVGRLPSFVELNYWSHLEKDETDSSAECVLGFGGSISHHLDWKPIITPLLRALDAYSHVRAEFVGYMPEEFSGHPQVRYMPNFKNLASYHGFLRQASWSIGLAPLEDTFFNRGKTNNKFREFAGLGIPGLYSDMPVYSNCVRHLETGFLFPHTEEGFHSAICTMIENNDIRKTIAQGALQEASSTYSLLGMQLQFLQEFSVLAMQKQYRAWAKPKLLLVGHEETSPAAIGLLQPFSELKMQNQVEYIFTDPLRAHDALLDSTEGIFIMRAFAPENIWLLDSARDKGIPVISAWDDDFFAIEKGTPLGDYCHDSSVEDARRRFLMESSLVMASTPPLVDLSRKFNDAVLESPYGFNFELPGLPQTYEKNQQSIEPRTRIGFFGGNTAIKEPWVVEALQNIKKKYGKEVILEVISGTPIGTLESVLDFSHSTPLSYIESLQLLKSRRWDIGLAPLADTPFNAAKQATKFRDYAWCEAAMICSKVPAYERTLIHGVHCLFTENTSEAWERTISRLIENPKLVPFLKKGAKKLLETVHKQDLTNAVWQQLVWRIGVRDKATHSRNLSYYFSPTSEVIENIGSPLAKRVRLKKALRYSIVPSRARWKGIDIFIGIPLEEAGICLDFHLCVQSTHIIRKGHVSFNGQKNGSWIRFRFQELENSPGRQFHLKLSHKIFSVDGWLLETQKPDILRHFLGGNFFSKKNNNLFARLVYNE